MDEPKTTPEAPAAENTEADLETLARGIGNQFGFSASPAAQNCPLPLSFSRFHDTKIKPVCKSTGKTCSILYFSRYRRFRSTASRYTSSVTSL